MPAAFISPKFQRVLWWLVLLAAADCCLLTLAAPGTGDVQVWLRWLHNVRDHGLVAGYAASLSDYTPLSFVLLRLVAWSAETLGIGYFIVLKVTITLFAGAGALVLWTWRRNIALTACFLAALVVSSSALGYLDVVYLPPLLLSLWALEQRRLSTASFWFAIATSVKWQPLLVAPFFLLAACRPQPGEATAGRPPWLRVLLGAAPVAIVMIACFGFAPLMHSFAKALSHRSLSSNGLNPPWLLQWFLGSDLPAGAPLYSVQAPRLAIVAFKIAFLGVYAFFVHGFWRHGRTFGDFLWAACAAASAYFTLNTGVHENHLFIAMIMAFALFGTGERIGWLPAVHCAVMLNLNLLIFYGFNGQEPLLGGGAGIIAVAVSGSNAAFLAFCVWRAVDARTKHLAVAAPAASTV